MAVSFFEDRPDSASTSSLGLEETLTKVLQPSQFQYLLGKMGENSLHLSNATVKMTHTLFNKQLPGKLRLFLLSLYMCVDPLS